MSKKHAVSLPSTGWKIFEKQSLERLLQTISKKISAPMTLYLIGGGNLSLRGLKPTTKDVDLVVISHKDLFKIKDALHACGFEIDESLFAEAVYRDAVLVFCDASGSRIDVFVKTICNQLQLSEAMIKRSELYRTYGKLRVMLVAAEDIFLFKSLTGREQDIEDGYALIDAGIDWDVVIAECVAQHRKEVKWIFWLFEHLCRLEETKAMTLPAKSVVLHICGQHWSKRPADFMDGFTDDQLCAHLPKQLQKEVLMSLRKKAA